MGRSFLRYHHELGPEAPKLRLSDMPEGLTFHGWHLYPSGPPGQPASCSNHIPGSYIGYKVQNTGAQTYQLFLVVWYPTNPDPYNTTIYAGPYVYSGQWQDISFQLPQSTAGQYVSLGWMWKNVSTGQQDAGPDNCQFWASEPSPPPPPPPPPQSSPLLFQTGFGCQGEWQQTPPPFTPTVYNNSDYEALVEVRAYVNGTLAKVIAAQWPIVPHSGINFVQVTDFSWLPATPAQVVLQAFDLNGVVPASNICSMYWNPAPPSPPSNPPPPSPPKFACVGGKCVTDPAGQYPTLDACAQGCCVPEGFLTDTNGCCSGLKKCPDGTCQTTCPVSHWECKSGKCTKVSGPGKDAVGCKSENQPCSWCKDDAGCPWNRWCDGGSCAFAPCSMDKPAGGLAICWADEDLGQEVWSDVLRHETAGLPTWALAGGAMALLLVLGK